MKPLLGSKSHHPKKPWYRFFVVRKKHLFRSSEANPEPLAHLKWCFFAKIVYSLKSLTILVRSSRLRSVTGCWIYLGYFSDLQLLWTFFLLLTFLNVNGTTILYTTGIPQQCLSCRLDVLVNFVQIFARFVGTFTVDFEYYLFIVDALLWHIFVENQKGVIFMGVVAKH